MSKDTRIDLTKFEGLTTPWDFHAKYLHIESAKVAVKLIAELKRCYAMLDAIAYEVAPCSECGGHREEEGLFHDCQNYCTCEDFDDASE